MQSWPVGAVPARIVVAQATAGAPALAQTLDVKLLDVKQGHLELGLDNTVLLACDAVPISTTVRTTRVSTTACATGGGCRGW